MDGAGAAAAMDTAVEPRPGWVPFADGTAAHVGCYEEAEVARLLEASERAVAGVVAT